MNKNLETEKSGYFQREYREYRYIFLPFETYLFELIEIYLNPRKRRKRRKY